jgi:hypothetical protein
MGWENASFPNPLWHCDKQQKKLGEPWLLATQISVKHLLKYRFPVFTNQLIYQEARI